MNFKLCGAFVGAGVGIVVLQFTSPDNPATTTFQFALATIIGTLAGALLEFLDDRRKGVEDAARDARLATNQAQLINHVSTEGESTRELTTEALATLRQEAEQRAANDNRRAQEAFVAAEARRQEHQRVASELEANADRGEQVLKALHSAYGSEIEGRGHVRRSQEQERADAGIKVWLEEAQGRLIPLGHGWSARFRRQAATTALPLRLNQYNHRDAGSLKACLDLLAVFMEEHHR